MCWGCRISWKETVEGEYDQGTLYACVKFFKKQIIIFAKYFSIYIYFIDYNTI